jgi:hypothetical protein
MLLTGPPGPRTSFKGGGPEAGEAGLLLWEKLQAGGSETWVLAPALPLPAGDLEQAT